MLPKNLRGIVSAQKNFMWHNPLSGPTKVRLPTWSRLQDWCLHDKVKILDEDAM